MSSSRRFLAGFAGVGALCAALLAAAALLTDPTGLIGPAFPSLPRLCAPGADLEPRRLKPLLAASVRPREIVAGTSRALHAFAEDDVARLLGSPAVNLGIPQARMSEAAALIRTAWSDAPVERVWLGIDHSMFYVGGTAPLPKARPLPPALQPFSSGEALRRPLTYLLDPSGCRWRYAGPTGFVRVGTDNPDLALGEETFARWEKALAAQYRRAAQDPERDGRYRLRLEVLRGLVREARDRRAGLVLFIAPTHPRHRTLLGDAGLLTAYDGWRRDMAALARQENYPGLVFFDASNLFQAREPRCERASPAGCPFQDFTHYRPVVGRALLELGRGATAGRTP